MARIALVLVLFALTAEPAYAGSAYGVLVPGETLLTFDLDGDHLRAAALRTTLECDDGGTFDFAADFDWRPPPARPLVSAAAAFAAGNAAPPDHGRLVSRTRSGAVRAGR